MIGPDEADCEQPTLIDYCLKHIPDLLKRLKKSELDLGQALFGVKNTQSKMKRALEADLPSQFRQIERMVE